MNATVCRSLFSFILFASALTLLSLVAPGENSEAETGTVKTASALAPSVSDVNLITGAETSPRVTQNTSATWSHGNTVVVVYEDSSGLGLSPSSNCGVSVSTDGGATFTRSPFKFNNGGACYGGPAVFYSVRAAKWYVDFVSARCGPGTRGIVQWESPDGINWTGGVCAVLSMGADRPTSWVVNNPANPDYGRQSLVARKRRSSPAQFPRRMIWNRRLCNPSLPGVTPPSCVA